MKTDKTGLEHLKEWTDTTLLFNTDGDRMIFNNKINLLIAAEKSAMEKAQGQGEI